MKGNFEQSLALVLKHEGGWVDHPKDPGGETMMGVTKRVWEAWIGKSVKPGSMKSLTVADVTPLYKDKYWDVIRGDDLPDGVDYALFDFAVNSGTTRAIRTVQEIVGVTSDGMMGPKTLAAIKSQDPGDLAAKICDKRLEFLRGLTNWPTFGRGWTPRVAAVKKMAVQMA